MSMLVKHKELGYTYQEDSNTIANTLHGEFIIGEVIIVDIEHLECVDVTKQEHAQQEAYYHIHALQVENTRCQTNSQTYHLSEPEHKVKCFQL